MNDEALKARIKVAANEKGVDFNEIWKQLILERFLARLAQSEHQNKFIFKGGLLLAQYLTIGRETTDADFLINQVKAEASLIEKFIKEVASEGVDDGFRFDWASVDVLSQPHMANPGFRVSLQVLSGKMKDKVQLDIGVGDPIEPIEKDLVPITYKGKPIFKGDISLMVYPIESIFAEKIETIVSKGPGNSRMKDYHDVVVMIREDDILHIPKLKKAIRATFVSRETEWKLPIEFTGDELKPLQTRWNAHLRSLRSFKEKLNLPDKMKDVLKEMNAWLKRELGAF